MSECRLRKMVLKGDLRLLDLTHNFPWYKQIVQILIRRSVMRRLIWVCKVCQRPSTKPSPGFTNDPLYTALERHSDKNRVAINNGYLDLLVNENRVDSNLKEILVYVYFGLIVNSWPNNNVFILPFFAIQKCCMSSGGQYFRNLDILLIWGCTNHISR